MPESSSLLDHSEPESTDTFAASDESRLPTSTDATAALSGAPITPEADALLHTLRGGLLASADEPARDAARDACRRLALALNLPPSAFPATATPAAPTPLPIAAIVDTLRTLPPDKLLDLAIQRLRAALPAGASVAAPEPVRFQLVPVFPAGGRQ